MESDLEVHSGRMRRYEHKLQQGKYQLNGRGKWGNGHTRGSQMLKKGSEWQWCLCDLEMFQIWLAKAPSRAKLFLLSQRLDQRALETLPSLSYSVILSNHTKVMPIGFLSRLPGVDGGCDTVVGKLLFSLKS